MANPLKQYVWDLRYIDAPVLRWRDENTDGTVDDTLYSLNDANMNVTAVVDGSDGDVVERYAYDPYGKVTVLNGEDDADGGGVSEGSADADNVSDWDNRIGYCGYRLDPETGANGQGIMHVRWRMYHATLGGWVHRDWLGYVDGMNHYTYCTTRPVVCVDPSGLSGAPTRAPREAETWLGTDALGHNAPIEVQRDFEERYQRAQVNLRAGLVEYLEETWPLVKARLIECMDDCGNPNAEIQAILVAYDAFEKALVRGANENLELIQEAARERQEAIKDAPCAARMAMESALTLPAKPLTMGLDDAIKGCRVAKRIMDGYHAFERVKGYYEKWEMSKDMAASFAAGGQFAYLTDTGKMRDIESIGAMADKLVAEIKAGALGSRADRQDRVKARVDEIGEQYGECTACCTEEAITTIKEDAEQWWTRSLAKYGRRFRDAFGKYNYRVHFTYGSAQMEAALERAEDVDAPYVPNGVRFPEAERRAELRRRGLPGHE